MTESQTNMRQLPTKAVLCIAVLATIGSLWSQTPPTQSFEVASVRLNKTGGGLAARTINPGSLIYMDVVLAEYIELAYGTTYRQLSGPKEIYQERYDIVAEASGPASRDEIRLMLRALLEDRF